MRGRDVWEIPTSGARAARRRPGMWRPFCRAALVLLAVLWRGAAAAQPAPSADAGWPVLIRLEFARGRGTDACPGADYFENRVTVLLGGKSPFSRDGDFLLRVSLEPFLGGHRGRLELFAHDGMRIYERQMELLEDCAMLASALALTFATAWKETNGIERRSMPREAAPETPPAAPPAATRPPPAVTVPDPIPLPGPPVQPPVCLVLIGGYCFVVDIYSFGLSTGMIMTAGVSADVGPGAWLAAEIRPVERFSFEVALRGTFPARVVYSEPIDPTKPYETPKEPDFSGVAVLFVPCFRYSLFMGCVVGQVGFNVSNTPIDTAIGQSIGLGPRLGVEIPFLERFAVRVWGDAIFAIPPLTYRLSNVNLKWTESPVGGFFGAGVGVNFK
jgi:hypothetical protein